MTPHRLLAAGLALMCALAVVGAALLSPLHAKNPALQAELVAMQDANGDARAIRNGVPPSANGPGVRTIGDPDAIVAGIEAAQAGVAELNVSNLVRLKAIIDQYGWPGKKLAGSDGSHAAWVIATLGVGREPATIAQDSAFLVRVLELMKRAGDDVSKTDRAWLDDRVAAITGQPQTYGTQLRCEGNALVPITPIRDQAHVDERREAVGLKPIKAQMRDLAMQTGCGFTEYRRVFP